MRFLFALLLCVPMLASAIALTDPYQPVENNRNVKALPDLAPYVNGADLVAVAHVTVESDREVERVSWKLTHVDWQTLAGKLRHYRPNEQHPYNTILAQAPTQGDGTYKGLKLSFEMKPEADTQLPALRFYDRKILNESGEVLLEDSGRELEYWLFGTTKDTAPQLIALTHLPIFTYDQCTNMRFEVVNTRPRQCVMPNGLVLLQAPGAPVMDPLLITDFDTCLEQGIAIIETFPRRCVTKGGKLIPEPPRRPDGSVILPGQAE